MRLLLIGEIPEARSQAARDALAEAAHAWGVEAIVCAVDGLPTDHCEALGVEVKRLRDPDPVARQETIAWLLEQGMFDRIIALPAGGGCPLALHVKALERRVSVYELRDVGGELRLELLPLSRARAQAARARPA